MPTTSSSNRSAPRQDQPPRHSDGQAGRLPTRGDGPRAFAARQSRRTDTTDAREGHHTQAPPCRAHRALAGSALLGVVPIRGAVRQLRPPGEVTARTRAAGTACVRPDRPDPIRQSARWWPPLARCSLFAATCRSVYPASPAARSGSRRLRAPAAPAPPSQARGSPPPRRLRHPRTSGLPTRDQRGYANPLTGDGLGVFFVKHADGSALRSATLGHDLNGRPNPLQYRNSGWV